MSAARIVLLLAALLSGAIAATANAAGRPTITVVERAPLVVRGVGFRPGERVTLRVLSPSDVVTVKATARSGRFQVAIPPTTGLCLDSATSVSARGSGGSAAFVRLAPVARCIPPPPVE